jgi:DNA-binding transcriptional regulator YdaS (Cro superfamily)
MKKLKELIQKRGDQAKLARLIGVSQPLLSYWLKVGQIPVHQIYFVSRKTGIAEEDLLPEKKE